MTLIEALKSGKRFKRKVHENWIVQCWTGYSSFYQKDILADDWIVENEKYEMEALWPQSNQGTSIMYPYLTNPSFDFSKLKGKKTKLTIEVLD